MAVKRVVNTEFWTDSKVIDMFSVEDKYFMLYLLTNPHTTQLGIYELNVRQASFETGYTVDVINVLLERFEKKYGLIKYSEETKEIAIGNYLRHSIMKGGKPVEDLLKREMKKVKNKSLLEYSFNKVRNHDDLNETVTKIIEDLSFNENENNNDNDNDNDDSSTVRTTNRPPYADYQQIADMYNEICISFPRLTKISDARKKAINARLKQYTVEEFKKLFEMAEQSKFLKGANDRNWSANFDWLIKDTNMAKVLDGNYVDKQGKPNQSTGKVNKFNNFPQREYSKEEYLSMEQRLLNR